MESYRITHWPEPMPAGPGLPIRNALAAMSVGWATRRFLEREARLSRQAVDRHAARALSPARKA